ncbi:hypothetical protein E2C01_094975 [Portunus trituberculatus]|uniref:Uncharacterized protein n=1 Tax=Portunus trituberculatus TaxID=210409 RepID=A0A5B7K4J9_PORTR|nr:hypothetical protein [Portunus trituberculatus]
MTVISVDIQTSECFLSSCGQSLRDRAVTQSRECDYVAHMEVHFRHCSGTDLGGAAVASVCLWVSSADLVKESVSRRLILATI